MYQEKGSKIEETTVEPDAEESKTFWISIWKKPKAQNQEAEWLQEIKKELNTVGRQKILSITAAKVEKQIKKMLNWHWHHYLMKHFKIAICLNA